ncbi:MAG TPA: tRNA epoxyqueuosine(34) reductase QueG [Vicinamibacterales bacterium]
MALTSDAIKAHAHELGFDRCGIAPAEPFPELTFLEEWLRRGYAGTMSWMGRTARRRRDVREVVPSARSVIVTATVYNTDRPHTIDQQDPLRAVISRYAWGDDYHDVIRTRLEALLAWMRSVHPEPFDARVYVDTGPVQERVYGQYAGVGWIGKNTCLIDPELGSWIFLGTIICSLPIEPDRPVLDQCGDCEACLTACPTGAIVEPHVLDATRCISYLTIEYRKAIPEALRPAIGNRVYGCDICQDVCPWNRRAAVSEAAAWMPRPALDAPLLLDLWRMSDRELEALLEGTPMTRAGVVGLRRNLATALGNAAGHLPPDALDADEPDPDRPSLAAPAVAETLAWARRRLAERDEPAARPLL